MKKFITTAFAIALSFGVFAQQQDTMFVHKGQTIFHVATSDVDSIIFYPTGVSVPMGTIDETAKNALREIIDLKRDTINRKHDSIENLHDTIGNLRQLLRDCEGDIVNLQTTIFVKDSTITALFDTIIVRNDTISALRDTITARDGIISDLHDTISYLHLKIPIIVADVTLNRATATLGAGVSLTLTATIFPEKATNKNVIWQSSNTSVAIVNNTGLVTAVSAGTATITAITGCGSYTATCKVTVIPMTDCNFNTPGWVRSGFSDLGMISWGTIGNTDIESDTTAITGTDGRSNQVWSGAVFASACQFKTSQSGGTWGSFNADCRSAPTNLTGHFFTWCAVMRFADVLCPYPWRVPTMQDFVDLDLNLGGTGANNQTTVVGRYMHATTGTVQNPTIGGTWGGARFTGWSGNLSYAGSRYWSSTEQSESHAFMLDFDVNNVNPQDSNAVKTIGNTLRCVRNVE